MTLIQKAELNYVVRFYVRVILIILFSHSVRAVPLSLLVNTSTEYNCLKWRNCNYSASEIPWALSSAVAMCSATNKWNKCEAFLKENPELAQHQRSCSPRDLCEERLQSDLIRTCLESYWRANVDFYNAIKDLLSKLADGQIGLSKLSFNPTELSEKVISSLEEKGLKLTCLDYKMRTEMMCYAGADILSIGMGFGLLAKLPAISNLSVSTAAKFGFIERRKGSSVPHSSSLSRDEIKTKLLHAEYTSEMDNAYWMIQAAQPIKNANRVFIEVENAKLKELNDTIVDKDLVTSMTNFHKQLLLDEFDILKKKHPKLVFSPYSDFKSVRFLVEGKRNSDFDRDLGEAFRSVQNKFDSWVRSNNLVRESDQPQSWFKMGIGQTADESSSAARFGRTINNPYEVTDFNSPVVRNRLSSQVKDIDTLRSTISEQLKSTDLVDAGPNPSLKLEVFEILRKTKTPTELKSKLQKEFNIESIPDSTLSYMLIYAKNVDRFSPSLHVAKKEIASLDEAVNGGFSVDFAGMGAQNLKATAEALASSKNLDEALINARKNEQKVTNLFESKREEIRSVSGSTLGKNSLESKCSGDDCIGAFKRTMRSEDKQNLVRDLARSSDGKSIRMAFISPGIKNKAERSQMATHGEAIEKTLREKLRGEIEPAKLRGVLFAIDMQGTELGKGPVQLIFGEANNVRLTAEELNRVKRAFQSAVRELNTEMDHKGYNGYKPK